MGSKCDGGQDGLKPGEEMTPEEKEILQRLSAKAQRYQTVGSANTGATITKNPEQLALDKSLKQPGADEEDDVLHTDIYAANLTLLRNPV